MHKFNIGNILSAVKIFFQPCQMGILWVGADENELIFYVFQGMKTVTDRKESSTSLRIACI